MMQLQRAAAAEKWKMQRREGVMSVETAETLHWKRQLSLFQSLCAQPPTRQKRLTLLQELDNIFQHNACHISHLIHREMDYLQRYLPVH